MNKTLKKALIFFILLCVILLVVVLIQLFVINRNAGDGEAEKTPDIAVSTPPEDEPENEPDESPNPTESPSPDVSDSPDPTETTSPDVTDDPPEDTTQPTGGKKFELSITSGVALTLVADEALFTHRMQDMGDEFIYISPEGSPSIEVTFIPGVSAESVAPSFLDNYIEHTQLDTPGVNFIGSTTIKGETVVATDGTVTYEAWLAEIDNGFIAIVINYLDAEQKEALYKVLNTMELTGVTQR